VNLEKKKSNAIWYVAFCIVVFCWYFLLEDNQKPFLTVIVTGSENSDEYKVSVCNDIKTIRGEKIIYYFNECEGEIIFMDNTKQVIFQGVYLTSGFQYAVVFKKEKNNFSEMVVVESKY